MPEGDGINHLGKELISQAEKPLLEARLGDKTAFHSLEVIEGVIEAYTRISGNTGFLVMRYLARIHRYS